MTRVSENETNYKEKTYLEIEQDLRKKFRKNLWCRFTRAIREYALVRAGDKIAVCVSGGMTSMLMAKLFQELKRHNEFELGLEFLAFIPSGEAERRDLLERNARRLNIPLTIVEAAETEAADSAEWLQQLCIKARELGCNKLALGHHYDDVLETILAAMLYGGQIRTLPPKLRDMGMELIRPMYFVRGEHIARWRDYNQLQFSHCADKNAAERGEAKRLIKDLKAANPFVEKNIFKSVENVNLDTIIAYWQNGEKHCFLDGYEEKSKVGLRC